MRRTARVAAPIVVVVLAVLLFGRGAADGGGSPEPTDPVEPASAQEFCTQFFALRESYATFERSPGTESVDGVRTAAASMRATAERFEMPVPARSGLNYFTALFEDLPPGATPADLLATDDDATLQESADADALSSFVSRTCYDEPVTLE